MLTFSEEQAHLRLANKHLRTAVYLVAVQESRVADDSAAGLDTSVSRRLLTSMHETLRLFVAHRQMILKEIDAMRHSPD
jgi:hypothetical protein